MKPLVYYCRWQRTRLRLHGRDDHSVWGQLIYTLDDGNEEARDFRYRLEGAILILEDGEGEQLMRLNEKGVPLSDDHQDLSGQ